MLNCIVNRYNSSKNLPKWIILIPEADIIKGTKQLDFGMSEVYGKLLNWLMSEINAFLTQVYAEKDIATIPKRTKIIWLEPTLHVNHDVKEAIQRKKFIRSLHVVCKSHHNAIALALKQGWNEFDRDICYNRTRYLSYSGVTTYWKAVDNTVKYADVKLLKSAYQPIQKVFNKYQMQQDMIHRMKLSDEAESMRRNWVPSAVRVGVIDETGDAPTNGLQESRPLRRGDIPTSRINQSPPRISSPDSITVNSTGLRVCQVRPIQSNFPDRRESGVLSARSNISVIHNNNQRSSIWRVEEEGTRRPVLAISHVHRHYERDGENSRERNNRRNRNTASCARKKLFNDK